MNDNEFVHGHRDRMLQSFENRGGSSFENYQILEKVLFYVIPRKDVKPVAKRLIAHFGSLEKVFSASVSQLVQVDGVGEKTAVFITLLHELFLRMCEDKCCEIKRIDSLSKAADYFREMFRFQNAEEHLALMMLDNSNNIIDCSFVSNGTPNAVHVNIRDLVEPVLSKRAVSVIVAHNHPDGVAFPSSEDIDFTLRLRNMLASLGIYLEDHIILNHDEAFSMRSDLNFVNYFEKSEN